MINNHLMNLQNEVRFGETEQIIVAFQVVFVVKEAGASEIRFLQLVSLDHGAHATIKHHDSLPQHSLQLLMHAEPCKLDVCIILGSIMASEKYLLLILLKVV